MIIIIAFKGAIRDFLQSPHSAANCLRHVRSSGPGAIVSKSRATHRALITCKCHVTCHLVRRDSSAIKFDRVEIAFIWALFYWLKALLTMCFSWISAACSANYWLHLNVKMLLYCTRYKSLPEWADHTIAFYNIMPGQIYSSPSCGILYISNYLSLEYLCSEVSIVNILCEMESETHLDKPSLKKGGVSDLSPSNETLPLPHVACPLGHVTLDFLACDVRSACWSDMVTLDSDKWGIPSVTSCAAPLTSLPPSFECSSGDHVVPFSLVCNHRSDCLDSSDERFCEYPPCRAKLEMMCLSSKQVRLWIIYFFSRYLSNVFTKHD